VTLVYNTNFYCRDTNCLNIEARQCLQYKTIHLYSVVQALFPLSWLTHAIASTETCVSLCHIGKHIVGRHSVLCVILKQRLKNKYQQIKTVYFMAVRW